MQAVTDARDVLSCSQACAALSVSRASYYRAQARASSKTPGSESETGHRKASPRALSSDERCTVLGVLHEPRFADLSVPQVWATLLDEEQYLCSKSTMYRILGEHGEVRERRDQLRRPHYSKPELVATAPNQVWSWDITKLRGPQKWTYYYLYVVLDVFSRYAVGWMVARCENAMLAKQLVVESVRKHGVQPRQLTIHSDRGAPMTSKSFALLLADLGITQSLSRPHVSDDNPFSEAHFKTIKYRPEYPDRFGSIEDARDHCVRLFDWYHHQHRHSGLGWMTPADVHFGRVDVVRAQRARGLDAAYRLHPERFVRRAPTPPALPTAVWINPPRPAGMAITQ
jgi:transposase InsO family protein